ncbi:MAG: SDR family NAD(P)-dependent oxidoreductase [Gemmatimonadota bacterium]
MNLHGKAALVTGGARRVGAAISRALARAGAGVVINYHSSEAEAEQLRASLQAEGARATTFRADVSSPQQIADLIEHVADSFGRLDIVINNASLFESMPVMQITESMWDRVLDTNLKGPFFVAQRAAPLMRDSGGGNIINIADLSAFQPWPSYAHHSISKAGLVQLTRVLARALAPEIRVNGVAPGTVLPPDGYDGTGGDGTSDRRVVAPKGTPEDVTRAIEYLLESNFVTGQVVIVDGGRLLL